MWELLRPVQYLFLRRTVELVTAVQASNKLSGIAQLFTSSLSKLTMLDDDLKTFKGS